jgi:hypothetical protein
LTKQLRSVSTDACFYINDAPANAKTKAISCLNTNDSTMQNSAANADADKLLTKEGISHQIARLLAKIPLENVALMHTWNAD